MLGVLALAGAAYLAAPLLGGGATGQRTHTVYAVSAAVTAQCEGLVLREERPLVSQDGYLLVAARDGERLPAGGLIAVEARSAEALAAARGALFDGARDVPEAVMALSEAVDGARGDVRAALDALETALSGGRTEAAGTPEGGITADEPGLFSSYSDGLWQLAAEDCDTPPEIAALLAGEVPPAPEGAYGSLVTGTRWRFAALVDEDAAAGLAPGGQAQLTLAQGTFSVRVESVSPPEGGQCAVLFSCGGHLADMLHARRERGELAVTRAEGLYVPAEALHGRGTERYVIVSGPAGPQETAVTPVCEYAGGWLLETGGALREGAAVLLG